LRPKKLKEVDLKNDLNKFPVGGLDNQIGYMKQLAQIFKFCIECDYHKVQHPSILSDMFFYRRLWSRFPDRLLSKKTGLEKLEMSESNQMSLMLSYPNPMMSTLNEFMKDSYYINVVDSLTYTATVALDTLIKGENTLGEENITLLLSLMTGCIIALDSIDPSIFSSKCKFKILNAVQTLVKMERYDPNSLLKNTLKYTTSLSSKADNKDATYRKLKKLLF